MKKWTKIKDGLPDESMACLVYTRQKDIEIAWYMQDDKGKKHFFPPRVGTRPAYSIDEQITHWMPAPEVPHN